MACPQRAGYDRIPEAFVGLPARTRTLHTPPTVEDIAHAAALACLCEGHEHTAAELLGVSRRTLSRWKRRPEYQAAELAAGLAADAAWRRYRELHEREMRDLREWWQHRHEAEIRAIGVRRRTRKRRPW